MGKLTTASLMIIIILLYPFIMKTIENMNVIFVDYLKNHFTTKTIVIAVGLAFFLCFRMLGEKYAVHYIIKNGEIINVLPNVDWKIELGLTKKVIVVCILAFIVNLVIVLLAFWLNFMGLFIIYLVISVCLGLLTGNHSFSQRIKFQKKMIAETNNRLELKEM